MDNSAHPFVRTQRTYLHVCARVLNVIYHVTRTIYHNGEAIILLFYFVIAKLRIFYTLIFLLSSHDGQETFSNPTSFLFLVL